MITNRKFAILLGVCIVIYFVSDYFFNGAVFYLVGGALGTVSKWIGLKKGFYLIWAVILVGIIMLFYKVHNRPLKVITIILIWALLYLIDAIFYEVMPDITSQTIRYSHMGISILLKSLFLAWIYYKGSKE